MYFSLFLHQLTFLLPPSSPPVNLHLLHVAPLIFSFLSSPPPPHRVAEQTLDCKLFITTVAYTNTCVLSVSAAAS